MGTDYSVPSQHTQDEGVHNQGILCTDFLKIISKYKRSFYTENFPKTVQGVLKSQHINEMVGDIAHCCAVPRNRDGYHGQTIHT